MAEQGESPRKLLAAAIKTAQPKWAVDNYPKTPEQVAARRPYIDVYETRRAFTADNSKIEIELEVNCYSGKTVPAAAEDDIEDIRDEVLLVLQALPNIFPDSAERVTYLETYPGYKITAKQYGFNPYKP